MKRKAQISPSEILKKLENLALDEYEQVKHHVFCSLVELYTRQNLDILCAKCGLFIFFREYPTLISSEVRQDREWKNESSRF